MQAKPVKNCYQNFQTREGSLSVFELDERLARDSDLITVLGLCQLRLLKDSRWPWLMLVPQRAGMSEVFELAPLDQALLTFETNSVAAALRTVTGATKINVGALGNIVRQLHVHVVARFEGDPNWPGPIWGFGKPEPYDDGSRQIFINKLAEALSS
jgi:diadenosine tetraphosphate (Ap4A) HIT family hydrolase